jgi:hypothetical protein
MNTRRVIIRTFDLPQFDVFIVVSRLTDKFGLNKFGFQPCISRLLAKACHIDESPTIDRVVATIGSIPTKVRNAP